MPRPSAEGRRPAGRGLAAALAFALALRHVGGAFACGHCVEDKIAATYDYGVVTRARAVGHRVYYFEVVGRVRPGDAGLERELASALGSVPGVDAGTPRVSLDPAAVSFAATPVAGIASRVARAVEGRLRGRGLLLHPLVERSAP
jgi:hypothetical protein